MSIIKFQPSKESYEAIARIEKAIWESNASSAQDFEFNDNARNKERGFQRYLVEKDQQIVAFGHWMELPKHGRYGIDISVHPDFERVGIGTAVYNHLITQISQQTPSPALLAAFTYSHKPQAVAFLEKRDFKPIMNWIISTLDVPSFDSIPFDTLVERVTQKIEIVSLPEIKKRDPNWQHNLYELDWEIAVDEPLPYAPQKPPFDEYCKREFENPKQVQEAWFVAVDNGRYVGMTQLFRSDDLSKYKTGFTGTVRTHRRRGLATVLKLHAIQYAQQASIRLIRTGNEENNPMYALNRQLGFQDLTVNIGFEKTWSDG